MAISVKATVKVKHRQSAQKDPEGATTEMTLTVRVNAEINKMKNIRFQDWWYTPKMAKSRVFC